MAVGPGGLLVTIAEGGDVGSLMTSVADTVRGWVGGGPLFLATADPVSGSFTGTFTFDIPSEAAKAFFAIEMRGGYPVSFASLAGSATPMGSLYAATDRGPARSQRWREVMVPLGWGDELRAAVRGHGSTWGYLCLHREAGEAPFDERDYVRLSRVLPAVAQAMRTAAHVAGREPGSLQTGVIVVDDHGHVLATTGAAEAWILELSPAGSSGLPLLVAGLARHVIDTQLPASSALTTRTGRSGIIHAAPLQHVAGRQVAVVISPAPPAHQLERLAAASGLTPREKEVVGCVLNGLSTRATAEQLGVSPYTVQAHLTSIFAKTGLRSRRDLVTRIHR